MVPCSLQRLTTGPERRRVGSSRDVGLAREKQDWHLARESNACGSARKACKGTGGLSPWANAMVTAAALLAGPRRRGTRSRKREQLGRSGRAYATHPRVTCMGCSMEGLLARSARRGGARGVYTHLRERSRQRTSFEQDATWWSSQNMVTTCTGEGVSGAHRPATESAQATARWTRQ